MVDIQVVFWLYVVVFTIIGGMRGWAKELLVTFSVFLAIMFSSLLEHYVPFVKDGIAHNPESFFWLRSGILLVLVFFGYQTPNITKFAPKMLREKFQDILLGLFIGAFNGFTIIGSLWFFLDQAKYPFEIITKPAENLPILTYLAPRMLGIPAIYFAVVVAFIFVIVVFV